MDREEANARLSTLAAEIKERMNEAMQLAERHSLSFNVEFERDNGSTTYTTHVEVDRYGNVDTWTSSTWNDSGCSDGWDDSGC